MKQGSATVTVHSPKVEPTVHIINPGGVAQIGAMVARNPTPVVDGRAHVSPAPVSHTTNPSGSQGSF